MRARITKLTCTVNLKFSGFEKGPFSNDSDAVQFLEEMRRKYENVKHDTRHERVSNLTGVNVLIYELNALLHDFTFSPWYKLDFLML